MEYLRTYENFNKMPKLNINLKDNIKNLLNKLKTNKTNKMLVKRIVFLLLSFYSISNANTYLDDADVPEEITILLKDELNKEKVEPIATTNYDFQDLKIYKNPSELKLSQKAWDHIRYEEGSAENKGEPVLIAYNLGDGKITIGYGHAENIKTSKYKVGDVITKKEANDLLIKDVNYAARGVKRVFKEWGNKEIDVKLTQNQYDVLVSLAYNKGIGAFRKSNFIQDLKKSNYEDAANSIKKEGDLAKFGGVKTRREKESKIFLT